MSLIKDRQLDVLTAEIAVFANLLPPPPGTPVVQTYTPVDGGVVNIDPQNFRNVIVDFGVIDNSTANFEFSLTVDTTNAEMGDRLQLFTKYASTTGDFDATINLSSDFYFTQCGDVETSYGNQELERLVYIYTFDGEKYVCTYDNC